MVRGDFGMPQKRVRVRIQKNSAERPEEEKADVGVLRKTRREEIKKKLQISEELIKEVGALLKDAAAKIKEAERLAQPFRYLPRIPNCEGRMIDLR